MPRMPGRPGTRTLLRALGRRLPRTRGRLRVDGLHAEVVIGRDRWGIPHVDASGDTDAWFALGFCHGQDRAFQLELLARAGRGRLAELLGAGALPIDRLSRTLGFRRVAAAQVGRLDPDVIETLGAYVAGINAAALYTPRPHELVLLRARRSRWRVEDVLAFVGLQSLALAGSWDTELARQAILEADGPVALAAVEPTYGPWLPVVMPPGARFGEPLARLSADLARLGELVGGSGGSNAWAVAGSRTASGAPVLANDPHLAPGVPPPWYLAHLRTPDWELAGASFVGGPAFPTGFNGHASWGITAACTDSADLFWEELSPDGGTARGPDGPEPVERIVETIPVRGAAPVDVEVLVTRRGPIVSGLLDGVSRALSMRATWLEPVPIRGFLDVARARGFPVFRDAFRAWAGPSLNVVYADRSGHVGWQMVGTLPRRRVGNGIVPLPAWQGGWEDHHLAFDDLPWTLDPPSGFVASANNAPRLDAPDGPYLGVDWLDGYRAARIVELLEGRDDWDVASSMAAQTDAVSLPWRDMRELVLAACTSDGPEVELLRAWDGNVAANSAAASVYELLVAALACSIARAEAPRGWRWAVGGGFGRAVPRTTFGARTLSHLVGRLRDGRASDLVPGALAEAGRVLRERHGPDPAAWAWGRIRPLRLRHALGTRRPLDRIFNLGPVPGRGDANTPAQAGVHPLDPLANPSAIANHRAVVDLGDPERSRFVLAGGQSGNPLSPHYGDLFELWQRGEGVPIAWTREAVEAATVDRLVLRR